MPINIDRYTYTPTPEHGIIGIETTLGNQFKALCRCGVETRAGSSPSTAFGYGRDHVIRESSVASSADPGEPPGLVAQPATPVVRKTPSVDGTKPPRAAAPCACLCGGTTGGGRYLSGHDSKHLKNLTDRINKGELTLSDAMLVLEESPKLAAKLAKRLSN